MLSEFLTVEDLVGYLGGAITLWGMHSRTMIPLRVGAVSGNLGLLIFGVLTSSYPTVVLHGLLLPLNSFRLIQMIRLVREIKESTADQDSALRLLQPYMKRKVLEPGTVIFSKGDEADGMVLIHEGDVLLKEINVHCGPGDVLGEIAAFTPENARTGTAECQSRCVVYSLNNETLIQLFYQNPRIGMFLTRTIVARLLRNWQSAEDRAKSMV